jgi:LEA14-like dessication related protein
MFKHGVPVLCISLLLAGCMGYAPVEFRGGGDALVQQLDAKGLHASVTVQVYNPNDYRITISDPDMAVYLNGVAVGQALLDSAVTLERNSDRSYTLPLHVAWTKGQQGLLPVLMASALSGQVKLGVKGTVVGKARWISKRVPVEMEQLVEIGGR